MNRYNVQIQPVSWGSTPQNALVEDEPKDIMIIDRLIDTPEIKPGSIDLHIHIVTPAEFVPFGKYNIGITAGLECTVVPMSWIEGMNKMDLVLASSNFGAEVLRATQYTNKETGQVIRTDTPVDVIFEGADLDTYHLTRTCSKPLNDCMMQVKEDWNFLFCGHWLQGPVGHDRKDVGILIREFLINYKSSMGIGLILKTNGASTCVMDRDNILQKIHDIKTQCRAFNDDLPNVYLLHADLHDSEVNDLYNHPKVKAHITYTHGEGYGRPLLEATMSEKPVIAPNWSGHTDFLHKNHSVLLPGGMIDVHPDALQEGIKCDGQQWFAVDHSKARGMIFDVKRNYRKYKLKARKQAKLNRQRFSFVAMQNKLSKLLDTNVPPFTQTVEAAMPTLKLPKLEKV
jgi:glycosyltransferase involved in cell wall biosynthesis